MKNHHEEELVKLRERLKDMEKAKEALDQKAAGISEEVSQSMGDETDVAALTDSVNRLKFLNQELRRSTSNLEALLPSLSP